MIRFIFDLDGTITKFELLPYIAKHFGVEEQIKSLTRQTETGNIPYMEGFIKRVHLLSEIPIDEIAELLEEVPFYEGVFDFISSHQKQCELVSGNLDCWIENLCHKIPCDQVFSSEADIQKNAVKKIRKILHKEKVIEKYKIAGDYVVMIGEGNNDLEAMRTANISIASGLTHKPANSVMGIADYVIFEEKTLCRQLSQLLSAVQE